ncbi:MATE family efflux transporter [Lewinellaceae bacterium SD302]|nr:MATE family efflux transporter [Lewinellaceae bacterium SD302]
MIFTSITPATLQRYYKLFKAALRGEENDFSNVSINHALVMLAVPMMLEMAMESVFSLVDTYFVGRIGNEALNTIGYTEVVLTLVYSIAIGLSVAPMAMVARFVGEKNMEDAGRAARQALWLGIAVSVVIGAFGLYYAEDILRAVGASEAVIQEGLNYTRLMFGGNIVIMLLFLLNGVFRGAGEASRAMRVLWLANGINIVLDPLFIFGIGPFPELGVTGAAVATNIGRGVAVLYQLYILFSGRSVVNLSGGKFRFDGSMMKRILNVASTGAFQYLLASASWIFLMRIVSKSGEEAVAGYVIAIRLIIFTLLPAWGLANATATFVGQNLGSNQPGRAETAVWKSIRITTYYILFVTAIYLLFTPQLIGAFVEDPAAVEYGITALRIIGGGYILFGFGMIFSQAFNGAGDTRTPSWINFICFWLLEIPLGYLLGVTLDYGVAGVCFSVVIAEATLSLIAYWLFRKGNWKTTSI